MVWAAGPTSALETTMARGTPDLVTVCLGANDLLTAMGRRSHQHESFDWVFVLWRIGVSRRYLVDAGFSDTLRDAGLVDVRANIEALARWLAARTPHLAIMTYPVADGSDVLRDLIIGPLNQMLREVAGDLGCGLIDLESLFACATHPRTVDRPAGRRAPQPTWAARDRAGDPRGAWLDLSPCGCQRTVPSHGRTFDALTPLATPTSAARNRPEGGPDGLRAGDVVSGGDGPDSDVAVRSDGPPGVRGNFPAEPRRVREVAVETTELCPLGGLEDGHSRGLSGGERCGDRIFSCEELGQGERRRARRAGCQWTDVGLERVGAEETKQQAVPNLDEGDLSGHVEHRRPTEPVTVEPVGRLEVRHAKSDEVHVCFHSQRLPVPNRIIVHEAGAVSSRRNSAHPRAVDVASRGWTQRMTA
jgi:hypothetical protein